MLTIGLTGGIGSGKTTVSYMFAALGATVIDTDIIAREIVLPKTVALNKIIIRFGDEICEPNGNLNRRKLREYIFNNSDHKIWLEQLLHPLIREEVLAQLEKVTTPYCLVVIPLLHETQAYYPIQRVLVVDTSIPLQIQRVQLRDEVSQTQVEAILKTQVSREQRLANADDIIINDGDLKVLQQKVNELHKKYMAFTKTAP